MADIFLSYSRTDKPRVAPLVAALEAKGWSVWWDMELVPGVDFDSVTAAALKSVRAVVVVWTATSVASRWVRGEARVGADRGVLVPVRFENAELPIDVRAIHTTDFDEWGGDPNSSAFQKLAQSLTALFRGAAPVAAPPATTELKLPSKPSLAVMPFANLSGDPEQEYFADGMVEEIVSALTRFKSLFVIASGSTLSFKGKAVSPQEAARVLGVRYILEGSARRAAGRVRIAVKLSDATDGSQIWSERFEDTLEDVFALQDRVADSVAGIIEPTIETAEIRRISKRLTEDMSSYDLFLRAQLLWRTLSSHQVGEALDLLTRAIALDPDFGLALAAAARCRYLMHTFGWSSDIDGNRRQGIELAQQALKAASDDAWVVAVCAGVLSVLERDFASAVALVDKAISLNSGSAYVWMVSGAVRLIAGVIEPAIEHLERSIRLDPMGPDSPRAASWVAMARFQQRRFVEAVALSKECLQRGNIPTAFACLVSSYGQLGNSHDALEALARYNALTSQPIEVFAQNVFGIPEHLRLFLDGIAAAQGNQTGSTIER